MRCQEKTIGRRQLSYCGVERNAPNVSERPSPPQTVRADFPHTAFLAWLFLSLSRTLSQLFAFHLFCSGMLLSNKIITDFLCQVQIPRVAIVASIQFQLPMADWKLATLELATFSHWQHSQPFGGIFIADSSAFETFR